MNKQSKIFNITLIVALISVVVLIGILVSDILCSVSNSPTKEQLFSFSSHNPTEIITVLKNYQDKVMMLIDPDIKEIYGFIDNITDRKSRIDNIGALSAKNTSVEVSSFNSGTSSDNDSIMYANRWLHPSSGGGNYHSDSAPSKDPKESNSKLSQSNASIDSRKNITDIDTNISALSGAVEGGNSSNLTADALIEAPKLDSTSVEKNFEASPNPTETISEAVSAVDSSAKSENSEAFPVVSKDGLVQSLEQPILQSQLNQRTQGNLNSQNKKSVSAKRTSTGSHNTQTRRTASQRRSLQTSPTGRQLNQRTQGNLNSQNKKSVSATRASTGSRNTQTRRTASQRRSLQTSQRPTPASKR
jgi:hypothetical protein